MADINVFVSVGGTANQNQEAFVKAVEERLRAEGIAPHTVGRNTFSADAPIKAINELMNRCDGAVVIALERTYFPSGLEKRGGENEKSLAETKFPTPWNQIEAAMAYSRSMPLLVVVEKGMRAEGLLEHGYDWYVQTVELDPTALNSPEFNGVLASWKDKVKAAPDTLMPAISPNDLTISQLLGGLKPKQLWSLFGAMGAVIAGAFTLGAKLFGS